MAEMTPTSPTTSSNQNLLGALTYLLGFITGIIFLLVEKENKFVRFHAMQSTITFGGLFILGIVMGFIPVLGWLVGILLVPVELILWLVLMYKAFSGEMFRLPYVGEMAEKQLAKMK
jgi:uncharacterized membrane protein